MKKILTFILLVFIGNSYAQPIYQFFINKIDLPIDNRGGTGYMCLGASDCYYGGRFEESQFLFSGGFWLSGYDEDSLWANAQASASAIENYIPGNVDSNQYDPRYDIYTVQPSIFFNYNWQRYRFAVENGADFYDGNGDGLYDPIDLNGNGRWDPDEDKPDILGSKTAWCVYNDGKFPRQKLWGSTSKGIEIHQTLFGYNYYRGSQLENVVFIRYKIFNSGKFNSRLDSVYFTAWADADLGGNSNDDLVGCDTLLNSGYTYNNGPDEDYGNNPPAFFITLLQGPQSYIPGVTYIDINSNNEYDEGIDTPIDTAYNRRGQDLGIEIFPGAANMKMTSFMQNTRHVFETMEPDSMNHARNYMLGLNRRGVPIDPCTFWAGFVIGGTNCNDVDPKYIYSGDPVNEIAWIDTLNDDQRMCINTGPFTLIKNKPITIIIAYVLGRGTDHLNSITKAKEIAEFTHLFYQNNFDENVVSVEDRNISSIPNDYNLFQNFPNPFNPATTIEFSVPQPDKVKLIVFDLLGREVEILVNEEKPQGNYKVTFNASSFPSGVYFYQLNTEHYSDTKKMIYLK